MKKLVCRMLLVGLCLGALSVTEVRAQNWMKALTKTARGAVVRNPFVETTIFVFGKAGVSRTRALEKVVTDYYAGLPERPVSTIENCLLNARKIAASHPGLFTPEQLAQLQKLELDPVALPSTIPQRYEPPITLESFLERVAREAQVPAKEQLLQAVAAGDLEGVKASFQNGARIVNQEEFNQFVKAALPHPDIVEYVFTLPGVQDYISNHINLSIYAEDAIMGGYRQTAAKLMKSWTLWRLEEGASPSAILNGMESFLRMALDSNQLVIAGDLIDGLSDRIPQVLRAYLTDRSYKLTEENLMFLLRNGGDSPSLFRDELKIFNEKLRIVNERGSIPAITVAEVEASFQYQALHKLVAIPDLPARFGLTAVEYAKKCAESPGIVREPDWEVTNEWYQMLLQMRIIDAPWFLLD